MSDSGVDLGVGSSDLQIIGAAYGLVRVTTTVIGLVNRASTPQSLSVQASNAIFGDTWPGVPKTLTVVYRYGETGNVQIKSAKENSTLTINGMQESPGVPVDDLETQPRLTVFGATYGPADETAVVRSHIDSGSQSLSLTANDATFGDPWPGVRKSLVIVAAYMAQVPFLDVVAEGEPYLLKYRPPLRVLRATWGLADVTAVIQAAVSRRTLTVQASVAVLGDGWPGVAKTLVVIYQYGEEQPQIAIAVEGSQLRVDYQPNAHYVPPPDPRTLNVIRAAYGRSDVTAKVATQIVENSLQIVANNALFGDTWPGTRKSFDLTYSWGPSAPASVAVEEGASVSLQLPEPTVSRELVALAGLLAEGDVTAIQAGNGRYIAVDPTTGRLAATAEALQGATVFTIHAVNGQSGQITLNAPGGKGVVVGQDGLLYAQAGGRAASLVPSTTTTGSTVLGFVGQSKPFASLGPGGVIIASGRDIVTFDTSFSLMMQATAVGLENHLRVYGVDPDTELVVSLELLKLVWDLTGGFFLAIGLGPLINEGALRTGIWGLLQNNQRVLRALQTIVDTVKANPGTTVSVASLFTFVGVLWDEGLMWRIFRYVLLQGTWLAIAAGAAKLLEWAVLPEAAAAQLVVSFAYWAYTTTMDALSYVNSGSGQIVLA